jgi:hypothetical protein
MDIGAMIALLSIVGSGGLIAVVLGGAWAMGRQHERKQLSGVNSPEELAARLARMERMLETLSTDVERIAESTRPALRNPM